MSFIKESICTEKFTENKNNNSQQFLNNFSTVKWHKNVSLKKKINQFVIEKVSQ